MIWCMFVRHLRHGREVVDVAERVLSEHDRTETRALVALRHDDRRIENVGHHLTPQARLGESARSVNPIRCARQFVEHQFEIITPSLKKTPPPY